MTLVQPISPKNLFENPNHPPEIEAKFKNLQINLFQKIKTYVLRENPTIDYNIFLGNIITQESKFFREKIHQSIQDGLEEQTLSSLFGKIKENIDHGKYN